MASSTARSSGLERSFTRNISENIIRALLLACALISVLTTIGVIVTLFSETSFFFSHPDVTWREFFLGDRWYPREGSQQGFGIRPLVISTLLVTAVALTIGIPCGLGSAIYLSEYAPLRLRRIIMPILEILAGIPTVVLGYFAYRVITPLLKGFIPGMQDFSALSAGIIMGFMILPTVSSISIDAMQAVPRHLREAAYGLGSTKGEVVNKVVVPAALSGILAAVILAMSRAIGETMIVTIAAGQSQVLTVDPREPVYTMTAFMANAAKTEQEAGSIGARSLYVVGATLFLMTLALNIISQQIVRRFSEKYE